MNSENSGKANRPWYRKKRLLIPAVILLLLCGAGLFVYNNFNKLLSAALQKNFNSNIVSDVYELKFEKLRVDLLKGDISVLNVVMQPREKPLHDYPYINSSFRLTTAKLLLKKVEIFELLDNNTLQLERIEIDRPSFSFYLAGAIHVMFPFKDSSIVSTPSEKDKKKTIDSFFLKEFRLIDAMVSVTNDFKQREFDVYNLNFSFNELYISQHVGLDSMSCHSISISIDSVGGTMLNSTLKKIRFSDFEFSIENAAMQKSLDTVIYNFDELNTAIRDMDVITADSIFHIGVKSFDLSYKEKSIRLRGMEFKPNISDRELQKRFPYQNTQASGTVGSLEIVNINFDSLMYKQNLLIDEIVVDSATVALFKDKTKPIDPKKFPDYLGQTITGINMPLNIKKVTAKNVTIVNRERKPDGEVAMVTVNRLQGEVKNVTNMSTNNKLAMSADAYLENKAHFKAKLGFDYIHPTFSIDATIFQFELKDLNRLLLSYTPAKLNSGTVDEIVLTGNAYRTKAAGTLKFLYHDLNIDLKLEEKAKWKSSLGAFAANTYLNAANNPASPQSPPKIVKYEAERDMHKGFINIVLKSLFAGVKETMLMSKENRKAFQAKKKDWKQKNKKDK